jgi:hypothetical protein
LIWHLETEEKAETVSEVVVPKVEISGQERCTRQFVPSADRNAKSPSSHLMADPFSVEIALQRKGSFRG